MSASLGSKFTSNTFATRKENLRRLVLDKFEGNRAALSRAAGVQQNQINLLLSDNKDHRRNMGEVAARRIETMLSLPVGWMDTVHDPMRGETTTVDAWDVPKELQHIIASNDQVVSVVHRGAAFAAVDGKISGRENLRYARMMSKDMSPLLVVGDRVLVDIGTKAVNGDGIYILEQGSSYFLRRCGQNLDGTWTVHAPNPTIEPVRLQSIKTLRAICRLVQVSRVEML